MPLCERPKKPDHCPSEIYSILLLHCWAHEPHQRVRFAVLKKMMDEVSVGVFKFAFCLYLLLLFFTAYMYLYMY